MGKNQITKPFLKWVGGKTQIIDTIINNFPKLINNYHEPFLGGGSVLLALLSYQKEKLIDIKGSIFAYDINEALINVYKNMQSNPEELYKVLEEILTEYKECNGNIINRKPVCLQEAMTSKESYYYWTRMNYNKLNDKNTIRGSAMFYFLNKTCFRGIYREGPNGFNVPFGNYKTVFTINLEKFKEISFLIENVTFIQKDFSEALKNTNKSDFIYLDPPYAPKDKKSFVGYNVNGFDINKHTKLFEKCKELKNNRIDFMMSNANVKLIQDTFNNEEYIVNILTCRRAVNSKKPGSTTEEVIIKPKLN